MARFAGQFPNSPAFGRLLHPTVGSAITTASRPVVWKRALMIRGSRVTVAKPKLQIERLFERPKKEENHEILEMREKSLRFMYFMVLSSCLARGFRRSARNLYSAPSRRYLVAWILPSAM